jgi:ergothioneine biosynthesis protein EgtB
LKLLFCFEHLERVMPAVQEAAPSIAHLVSRWQSARAVTDSLFEIVRPEFLYERPIAERHRIVFYIGHLEAFEANLLRPVLNLSSAERELDQLFAFGIDPVDGGLPKDEPSDWPSIEAVRRYNARVRAQLDAATSRAAEVGDLSLFLNVAIEHRLMHAETLAYMFHQLPLEQKISLPEPTDCGRVAVKAEMAEMPGGRVTLGLPLGSVVFGWDNEFIAHEVDVPAFSIDRYMVTNGQYLEFLRAGGYEEKSFWREEDWKWKRETKIQHPVFWKKQGEKWLWRGMFREFELPPNWPVYVSFAEAGAYARWAKKSLPSEAQWQRAAYGTTGGERCYPWGNRAPRGADGNFDFASWEPADVDAFPTNQSAFGVRGMLGNGWEWTSTPFAPLPGFKPFPFYPGYSANFFDGKHYVIKGGSARTAACMLRASFRNWFQPHYPYVYAGFRTVEN